jgi:hypothetical protein
MVKLLVGAGVVAVGGVFAIDFVQDIISSGTTFVIGAVAGFTGGKIHSASKRSSRGELP